MIKRARGLARRGIGAYVRTVRHASPNARRYLLLGVLSNVATGIMGTVFALYVRSMGMGSAVVGDVEGALGLAGAAVCIVLPPLISAVGYRWLLAGAGIAFAAARLGQITGVGSSAMIALGLVYGIGDGIIRSAGVAFLAENGPEGEERTMLFTVDFALRVAASFVGALIGGLLPTALELVSSEIVALRWTIGVAGALYLLSALPMLGVTEPTRRSSGLWRRYTESVRGFRSWERLARLALPQVFVSFGAGLIMPFVPLYLKVQQHASTAQVGFILGASSVVMALATLATPLVAKRFGLVGTVVLTQLASLPLLLAIPLAPALYLVALAMWGRAALMNMAWPVYNQISVEGIPAPDKPLVVGWTNVAWSGAWFLGSVVGGRLAATSLTQGYFITAGLYGFGAVMTWVFLRRQRFGEAAPSADSILAEHAEPQA